MISRLSSVPVSFKANQDTSAKNTSVRKDYDNKLAENTRIAQGQNNSVSNSQNANSIKKQIPMQGGQKLNVIA